MKENVLARKEVIMTGIGGGGILTAGLLLGRAASVIYENVICFPTHDISKRGGRIECTVIYSNKEIASPILDQALNVVVADPKQIGDYQDRVCSGGSLFIESTGFSGEINRTDVSIIEVPAIKTSIDISGDSRGAILVLLGTLIASTNMLSIDFIEQELKRTFAGKEKAIQNNLNAFRRGLKIAQTV